MSTKNLPIKKKMSPKNSYNQTEYTITIRDYFYCRNTRANSQSGT